MKWVKNSKYEALIKTLYEFIKTYTASVAYLGLLIRTPRRSLWQKSSSICRPGYGVPPSVNISQSKTPNDQLQNSLTLEK